MISIYNSLIKKKYFCLFLCTILLSACVSNQNEKPNILFIVVDDMGYADFEPFSKPGSAMPTPHLSQLANSGVIYTQAYTTSPVCSPSRVGIIAGKNQARWDKKASWGPGLPDKVKTMPEYLKDAGYTTALIGKSDLGQNFHQYDVREYPLKHGYDEFLGFSAHAHDYWLLSKDIKEITPDPSGTSAVLGPLMHNMGIKNYDKGYLTEILTDEAIEYIQRKREQPFFLMLSYNSLHHLIHEVPKKYLDKHQVKEIPNYHPDNLMEYSYHKPGSYAAYYDKYSRLGAIQDEDLRNYYLANLECLDDNMGRVFDELKKNGLWDNTIIVFISDNGGSPLNGANNAPLTAGKYALWEGGIRVPMFIKWPGKTTEGSVQDVPVSAADLLQTFNEELNIQSNDTTLDGINLFKPSPERLFVWKWQKTWAVRKGDWKLTNTIENHWKSRPSSMYIKPILNDTTLKLFNLKNDPGERTNLANTNPEKLNELRNDYHLWCAKNIGNY